MSTDRHVVTLTYDDALQLFNGGSHNTFVKLLSRKLEKPAKEYELPADLFSVPVATGGSVQPERVLLIPNVAYSKGVQHRHRGPTRALFRFETVQPINPILFGTPANNDPLIVEGQVLADEIVVEESALAE